MAGTNAVAIKRALVAVLAAAPALEGVQVLYSGAVPDLEREAIYLGKATWTQRAAAMRSGGRLPRQEELVLEVHLFIALPGSTPEEAEVRAQELGTVLEETLADDPAGVALSVAGTKLALVTAGELASEADDDAAYALLKYQLAFTSILN